MFQTYRDLISRIAASIEKGPEAGLSPGLPERLEDLDNIVLNLEPQAVPRAAGAIMVITPQGVLCSLNAPARDLFGLRVGAGLGQAAVSAVEWSAALLGLSVPGVPVGVMLADAQGELRAMVAVSLPDGKRVLVCEAVGTLSPPALRALVQLHGLGRAEQDVLALLVAGQGVEGCAQTLGRAVSTVRQQIKAILSKMGVHSQAQAVARALALAQTMDWLALAVEGGAAAPALASALHTPAGPVSVQRFGLPGGIPVLMFHGALTGIAPTPGVRVAAQVMGLDVIAPERPGYGATPLGPGADPVALAIAHALHGLGALGIAGRVIVLGHDIGSKFACAFARAHPDRVAALVLGPTTPPMVGWAQTADMPTRHRVNAWAAQRMPALMERIVALAIGQIHKKGVELIPALVYADCDFDRTALSRPEVLLAMHEVFAMIAMQDAAGFRYDMRLTNLDWSAWASEVTAPVTALHGAQSVTVSQPAVAAFVASLTQARLEIVPDSGHSLPLTHHEVIFRHVLRAGIAAGL